MMTKDFEKYFPLPWEVKIIDTATFIQSVFEPRCHVVEFNADNMAHIAALEYMVNCANLMPECIKVLRQARDGLYQACMNCTNGELNDCPVCKANGVGERIDALLAKLEREVEDYERVD